MELERVFTNTQEMPCSSFLFLSPFRYVIKRLLFLQSFQDLLILLRDLDQLSSSCVSV